MTHAQRIAALLMSTAACFPIGTFGQVDSNDDAPLDVIESSSGIGSPPTSRFGVRISAGFAGGDWARSWLVGIGGQASVGIVYQYSGNARFAAGIQPELLFIKEIMENDELGGLSGSTTYRFYHLRLPLLVKLPLGGPQGAQPSLMVGGYGDVCLSVTKDREVAGKGLKNIETVGFGYVIGFDVRSSTRVGFDLRYYHALTDMMMNRPETRTHSVMISFSLLF